MGSFSIQHWLILLAVVVLVFGTSKLKNIGKDVGSAVKDFKDSVKDETVKQAKIPNQAIDHQKINEDVSLTTDTHSETTNS